MEPRIGLRTPQARRPFGCGCGGPRRSRKSRRLQRSANIRNGRPRRQSTRVYLRLMARRAVVRSRPRGRRRRAVGLLGHEQPGGRRRRDGHRQDRRHPPLRRPRRVGCHPLVVAPSRYSRHRRGAVRKLPPRDIPEGRPSGRALLILVEPGGVGADRGRNPDRDPQREQPFEPSYPCARSSFRATCSARE